MKLVNDGLYVVEPKATFTLHKMHTFLSINGLRVCDFLMDIPQA